MQDNFEEICSKIVELTKKVGGFIVKQAGGGNSDLSGGDNYIFGKEIIAFNNNKLHQ